MNDDPYVSVNPDIPSNDDKAIKTATAARIDWCDIEACRDALTERQWAWVVSHMREGKSVGQIHGITKENLTRHDFGNDYLLGRGCMRLLRALMGHDVVVPSKGGAIESRANIASQKITWEDIDPYKSHFNERQWARVAAYYRDRRTLSQINGGTHAGKRDRVIGHASIRLLRLLLGLQVRSPRPEGCPNRGPAGIDFGTSP